MTEDNHRKWDIIIKGVITPIIAVITVFAGIYEFNDGKEKSLEKEFDLRQVEKQEEIQREKTAVYREARRVVSFLSESNVNAPFYEKKKERFWELYLGEMAVVESEEMETLMVDFSEKLQTLENTTDPQSRKVVQRDMKRVSKDLTHQTIKELQLKR